MSQYSYISIPQCCALLLKSIFDFNIVIYVRFNLGGQSIRSTYSFITLRLCIIRSMAVMGLEGPFQCIRASLIEMRDFFERFSEIRLMYQYDGHRMDLPLVV